MIPVYILHTLPTSLSLSFSLSLCLSLSLPPSSSARRPSLSPAEVLGVWVEGKGGGETLCGRQRAMLGETAGL